MQMSEDGDLRLYGDLCVRAYVWLCVFECVCVYAFLSICR